MQKNIAAIILLVGFWACGTTNQSVVATERTTNSERIFAKNIILMIGDGMGLGQITAGMYANGNRLHLEKFPVVGLQKTYSYDNLVTDSAAGATAIACGVKTYNAAIGVDKDTIAVQTILEEAEKKGLKTGLVATSTIVHATPAAFIAHRPLRSMYELIAKDFLKVDVDLLIGGGFKYFNTQRTDGRSLLPQFAQRGYTISSVANDELEGIDMKEVRKFIYFTANDAPIPTASGRDYLPIASKKAAEFLGRNKKKGFFLMIEGSQIDWGGHANDLKYITSELIDFDKAVGRILDFAKKNKETLVIVTADHETGGTAINPKSRMDSLIGAFTSSYHTATMVPVFAYGPNAELFSGIYENTAIHHKMRQALGFDQVEAEAVAPE
ncbi:MAG: alkaline phosphatase [Bacteroidota bacterium]